MTRHCTPFPRLVGAAGWLPGAPFEFGWAYGIGCNNLSCERCGETVVAEVPPDGPNRMYHCACRSWEQRWMTSHDIGGDHYDINIETDLPDADGWGCAGHPDLVLPATLDGIVLDAAMDWAALVARAVTDPPVELPPAVRVSWFEPSAPWLTRLLRLLGPDDRPRLHRAVAGLLDTGDARQVRAAIDFFREARDGVPVRRLAGAVAARREWLAATSDRLLGPAAELLDAVLEQEAAAGRPVERPAVELAEDLALSGAGSSLGGLRACDPEWLWANAVALLRANHDRTQWLLLAARNAPDEHRHRLLRELNAAAAARPRDRR